MSNEQPAASTDLTSSRNIAAATGQMNASAASGPNWLRRLTLVFSVIIVGLGLLTVFGKLSEIGNLPRCDSQRTKDTLSTLNKQNAVNASHYNFLKTVSTTKDEVTCTASLALRAGGTLEYDYRIYREDGVKVQITNSRRL